jgi:hypothetical protein
MTAYGAIEPFLGCHTPEPLMPLNAFSGPGRGPARLVEPAFTSGNALSSHSMSCRRGRGSALRPSPATSRRCGPTCREVEHLGLRAAPEALYTEQTSILHQTGTANRFGGHVSSPAAKRRPDSNSSRSSGLRKGRTMGMTWGVMARSRARTARASSSRPVWAWHAAR